MKKLILLSLLVLAASVHGASLRQIQLEIVDEFWQPVTNITQISVFNIGTSTATTISSDRAGAISMVNPITTSSTNTTFDQSLGFVRWFQRAPGYKVTITDGTRTLTIDNRTGSVTRFPWFANYIGTAASLSIGDDQTFTVGSDSDAVLSWVNASDILNWIPNVDGVDFNIGSTTVNKQFDFNVFVGGIGGGGLAISESATTFGWTGGVFNVNVSSNSATNINTGSSTGAVSIGNSASGVVTIDGTSTASITVDDDMALGSTAGTVTLSAAEIKIFDGAAAETWVIEGTANAFEASLTWDDPTTDTRYYIPPTPASDVTFWTSLVRLNAVNLANSVWGASNSIVYEGATKNAFETRLNAADPALDSTYLLPTAATTDEIALVGSLVVLNALDIANSVWMSSNTINYEGSTANAFETTLFAANATTDTQYILPVTPASNVSVLTSIVPLNAFSLANSVWAASNSLVFEGATKNAFEISFLATDPTSDTIYVLSNSASGSVAVLASEVPLNAINAANSVWASSNSMRFEGATANTIETTITVTDPTITQTLTIPDKGANSTLIVPTYNDYLTTRAIAGSECWGGIVGNRSAVGATATIFQLPTAVAGYQITFYAATLATDDAGLFGIDAFAGDTILGLAGSGDMITAEVATDHITLFAIDANTWIPLASSGAWSDGGAF